MKTSTLILIPLGIALYSFICTAAMLWWASREGRTSRDYQRGLIAYVAVLVTPAFAILVPAGFLVEQRIGLNVAWMFLLSTTLLSQLFPMLAAHGICAMAFPPLWRRLVDLRDLAYPMQKPTGASGSVMAQAQRAMPS